jgi:uncharacterized delta-60 repeat protein
MHIVASAVPWWTIAGDWILGREGFDMRKASSVVCGGLSMLCFVVDPGCAADTSRPLPQGEEPGLLALGGGAGSLDPSFGNQGEVTTALSVNGFMSVDVQSDGKPVVATTINGAFGVVRYLANGALDATFGSGGLAQATFTASTHLVYDLAIAPDGKILVAGSATVVGTNAQELAIARFNSDGSLDAGFGTGGKVTTTALGAVDVARLIVVQSDGKILVGGSAKSGFGNAAPTSTLLVRYLANGALDATFGSGGKVIASAIGAADALGLEPDGSTLVLHTVSVGTGGVARFSSSGAAQPVALSGTLTQVASNGTATFQTDGQIVVATNVPGTGRHDFDIKVTRYAIDGVTVDPTFSSPQFDFVAHGLPNHPNTPDSILVAPDGKVVVGGTGVPTQSPASLFGLARFDAGGSFDGSFGSGGIVTTQFNSSDHLFDIARQPDGKLLALGNTNASSGAALALARYLGP